MKILLTDDCPSIIRCVKMLCKVWGYDIDVAGNGIEGVAMFEQNHFEYDVCLMDINMPFMDGLQATRTIRRVIKEPYTPILCLSGDEYMAIEAAKAGMDGFIYKPFNIKEFQRNLLVYSAKITKIHKINNKIVFTKEKPVDKAESMEAVKYKEQDLEILEIAGQEKAQRFLTHPNTQNHMSHKLIGEDKELYEFLDFAPGRQTIVHLYKHNLLATRRFVNPEEFEKRKIAAFEELKRYTTVCDAKKKEDTLQ